MLHSYLLIGCFNKRIVIEVYQLKSLLTLTNTTWILGCHPQHGARVYKGIYEYKGSLETNLFYPQVPR